MGLGNKEWTPYLCRSLFFTFFTFKRKLSLRALGIFLFYMFLHTYSFPWFFFFFFCSHFSFPFMTSSFSRIIFSCYDSFSFFFSLFLSFSFPQMMFLGHPGHGTSMKQYHSPGFCWFSRSSSGVDPLFLLTHGHVGISLVVPKKKKKKKSNNRGWTKEIDKQI